VIELRNTSLQELEGISSDSHDGASNLNSNPSELQEDLFNQEP